METRAISKLEARIIKAAEAALAEHKYVCALDVLQGVGWLATSRVDHWRQGRPNSLEAEMDIRSEKLVATLHVLGSWAQDRLRAAPADYFAGTRDRRPLQFSRSGDPGVERMYRTHWLSPNLPEAKAQKLVQRQAKATDLVVISALKDWTCWECSGTGDFLFMEGPGPLCLACADLDTLVFLPSGDTALTRRARKASKLCAVVVRFSRSRGRYERQGLLVEEQALAEAEQQCLDDLDLRRRRRARDELRRADQDVTFQARFADEIRRQFPGCPPERAQAIAEHAGARGSGRVGRSAAGRVLDGEAVTLAVAASVRHEDTYYDELLMSGVPRTQARERVRDGVRTALDAWR